MSENNDSIKVSDLTIPGKISGVGLLLPKELSFEDWEQVVARLGMLTKACMWWWGDALNYGERKYGEMYAQALDSSDYDYQTLRNAAWVSSRIELSRRRDKLSWNHHLEVAALEPEQQDVLLRQAESEDMTRDDLRRAVRRLKATFQEQPLPSRSYRVIYADAPWQYNDKLVGRCDPAEHPYKTLSVEELCCLRISELAAPDAVLFLWVPSHLLKESFSVIEAWRFEYRASFVWDRVNRHAGRYNRVRHEFLLVCTRGNCLPDDPKLIDSVQVIERSDKHSGKPEEFRRIIDTLYPGGKRIELFRRGDAAEGWEAWGNE